MESYPLLGAPAAMVGVLDYKGRPVTNLGSGRWLAVYFILVMEMAERLAYNGILFNLINFMTGPLGESTAAAAAHATVWSGFSLMLPILGALVADTFSRYRTIVFSSVFYILGLGLLSLSASLPNHSHCLNKHEVESTGLVSCSPSTLKCVIFYFALFLVAFAQGGHRPCVQAFGADQFDEKDSEENLSRSSFFNFWTFGLGISMTISPIILSYIEEDNNWTLGFGIPSIVLGSALIVFLTGSRYYRCYTVRGTSPYAQVGRAFTTLLKRRLFSPSKSEAEEENECRPSSDNQSNLLEDAGESAMSEHMEEAKGLLRLFPIWASCLGYTIVFCQWETFFTKQGDTLDRKIGSKFQLPAAGLQSLTNACASIFILVYDRIAIPLARNITGIPSGITKLQRIGTGLLIYFLMMVLSALVEMKRLRTAREFGLVDDPTSVLPMSIAWLFPQYILAGLTMAFTLVGLQEFFYDQVPDGLRSMGIALFLSIFGVGSLINSFLVYTIDKASTYISGESWFSNNLNRAHLDYFYWLIALLQLCSFILFIFFARAYTYKQKSETGM